MTNTNNPKLIINNTIHELHAKLIQGVVSIIGNLNTNAEQKIADAIPIIKSAIKQYATAEIGLYTHSAGITALAQPLISKAVDNAFDKTEDFARKAIGSLYTSIVQKAVDSLNTHPALNTQTSS
jgi:urea transporter